MAALGKHVVLDFLRVSKNITRCSALYPLNYGPCRHLYAQEVLGIDNYVRTRDRVKVQFANMTDKFKSKMIEYSQGDSSNMIFTEDLKNMIHLAESSPEDIDLILQMMQKFNQQNKELRFGTFVFGPIVMRMYYHLGQVDAALAAFKDPALEGFFSQLISYQILLDLLFINERYEDLVEVFDTIVSRQTQGARYPKHAVVLALGALYKMNTPESLQKALTVWKNLNEAGHIPMRRAVTFAAALAVNQGSPHVALEILGTTRNQNYITVRNLKILALAAIGRPEDALPVIRNVLHSDFPEQRRQTIDKEVLQKLKEAIDKLDNKEVAREFAGMEKALIDGQHVDNSSIDHQLCSEIIGSLMGPGGPGQFQGQDSRPRNRLQATWGRQQQPNQGSWRQDRQGFRPGLSELE